MFQQLQLEVMDRFTAVRQHFRATRHFRGAPSQTVRGLVFVEIYAIWEYTIRHAVVIAGRSISGQNHAYADLRPPLQSLFLYSKVKSLRGVAEKRVWEKAVELLDGAASSDVAVLADPPVPFDGSHFRHTHLQLILSIFCITRKPTRRLSHLYRITEVVENRNSVAHGEETAATVGRRYTRKDIAQIARQMESVCLRLIALLSEQCANSGRYCR